MIGKTINQYLVLEKLGTSEASMVYKAQDLKLDRVVVLKAIDIPEHDADAMTSFQKETRAGVRLTHPNISSIFDVIEGEDGRFLIYEYQPGGSLRDRMQRASTSGELIPIDRCVEYILSVAQGLAEAHRHGIVHRDVSADNIIVTPTHAVKITNFGKARFDDGPTFVGTGPAIAAAFSAFVPEKLQGMPVDHRGDIYSLCSLLFELLTGEKAFRAKNPAAILHEMMYNAVPQMAELRPGISDGLQKIVEKGMAKNPDDRYSTMDLLVEDLRVELRDGLQEQEPLPDEPAVAVLPINAVGTDERLAPFCDGLTEEIGYQLQSVTGLHVAATTSAARFRGKTDDLRKVGAQLNVNLLLEGSARAAGNIVRVIMKLTDASNGYQIWSERFDRDLNDALTVQDELAQTATRVLRKRVGGEEIVSVVPTTSGMTSMFAIPTTHIPIPVRPLEMTEVLEAARGLRSPQEVLGAAITVAVKMPPDSVDAQVALGYANAVLGKTQGSAEQAFLRALELDPSNIDALTGLATHVLAPQGRTAEAEAALSKADPSSVRTILAAGWLRFWSGDFQGAVGQCRQAFKVDSTEPEVYLLLGRAYAALGQYREAIIACGRGRVLAPEDPRIAAALSYSHGRAGETEEANRLADELGSLAAKRYVSVMDVALPYAGLGLAEWVSCCVERAQEERPVELLWWTLSPEWVSYR